MRRARHLSLLGLVLGNLAFVFTTEAAGTGWLLLLTGLSLASPFLARFAERLLFRAAWNVAVLALFFLLIAHLRAFGAQHLLEDGLLLAGFCQVHLLNNLRRAQKPDLLFFNSFLIAVVTGFLSIGLGYCLAFLAFAPLLLVAMELEARGRAGFEGPLRPVVLGALGRSGILVALSFSLFLFAPRDFQRRGLLGEALRRASAGAGRVDFSERVSLDRPPVVGASDRVVLRAQIKSGVRSDVPAYWRGATLDSFDGREWHPAARVVTMGAWRRIERFSYARDAGGARGATVAVEMASTGYSRIFLPLTSSGLRLTNARGDLLVHAAADLTLRCGTPAAPLEYEVDLVRAERGADSGLPPAGDRNLQNHLWIDPTLVPPLARQLALDARAEAGPDASPSEIVSRVRTLLSRRYRYLALGASGGARDLEEFINGGAGAHCEFFATALAVMLRTLMIPCRVVTGYRSEEWDDERGTLIVRERHAHAWVEVLDRERGWYSVDATPAAEEAAAGGGSWYLAQVRAWLYGIWERITSLNARERGRLLEAYGPRAWLIAPVLLLLYLARRLRCLPRRTRAARAYLRAVHRAGLAPSPGETPRELLARAAVLPPARRARLEAATTRHERSAYSG